ncbi:MAG TPA: SDR family NAD(P)-dependent oxidoreductase [Methylocystis sp.]|nr:SDR family NAD(P)-dependent oxidoreductase [Methylocystis sp.]
MSAKHVVLTGASSGIGRALALRYAREHARLTLLGRDAVRLQAASDECRTQGAAEVSISPVDVQDRVGMARAIAAAFAAAPIDVLVANAGVATGLSPGQILESPDSVRATFAINVSGVFNTVEPALLPMTGRGSGMIAIVGSMAGVRGLPHSPAYCASKAAVHSYAESLRGVAARHGVDVSLIVPGFVRTPMSQRTIVRTPISQRTKSWQPGLMEPAEFAEIVWSGLERRKTVIAAPLYMYYALRFFTFLPPRLVDWFANRVAATVPETAEREAAE